MIEQQEPVTRAVVPAAGRGTRFLPITKSVPKEMLPIAGRPAIEYIIKEATDAGSDNILMVTRTGKQAIEDYFDADPALEAELEKPSIDQVRSDHAIVGRNIFSPIVFNALENVPPGVGGEYQLTDACAQLIATPRENSGGLYGVIIDESRYDTGNKLGYLGATIAFALADPDMGPALREYLNTQLNEA